MSNWLTLAVVGFSLTFFSLALAWAILHNLREGKAFRHQLARRLEQLRLHRLMELMGLSTGQYLHRERIVDVERHLRACASCTQTSRCDQILDRAEPEAVADFCANYDELDALRREREEAA